MFVWFKSEKQIDEEAHRDGLKIHELREDVYVLIGLLPAELLDHHLVKDIDARIERDIGGSPVRWYRKMDSKAREEWRKRHDAP